MRRQEHLPLSLPLSVSPSPSLFHSHSVNYSLTHPLTHTPTHSLTHSLTHSQAHSLTAAAGRTADDACGPGREGLPRAARPHPKPQSWWGRGLWTGSSEAPPRNLGGLAPSGPRRSAEAGPRNIAPCRRVPRRVSRRGYLGGYLGAYLDPCEPRPGEPPSEHAISAGPREMEMETSARPGGFRRTAPALGRLARPVRLTPVVAPPPQPPPPPGHRRRRRPVGGLTAAACVVDWVERKLRVHLGNTGSL